MARDTKPSASPADHEGPSDLRATTRDPGAARTVAIVRLTYEHDARTLAAALCARLTADKRGEVADALMSVLTEAGIVDPPPAAPTRTG